MTHEASNLTRSILSWEQDHMHLYALKYVGSERFDVGILKRALSETQ